jgi:hypothetical protein
MDDKTLPKEKINNWKQIVNLKNKEQENEIMQEC